jgi:hypothetical protein
LASIQPKCNMSSNGSRNSRSVGAVVCFFFILQIILLHFALPKSFCFILCLSGGWSRRQRQCTTWIPSCWSRDHHYRPNNLSVGYYGIPVTSDWLDIIIYETDAQCNDFLHHLSMLPRDRSRMHIGGPEGGNVNHLGGGHHQYHLYVDGQLLPNWQRELSHVHRPVPPSVKTTLPELICQV